MASETDICNDALGFIGAKSIQALATEQTVEARKCRQYYPSARNFVLSDHDWDFAESRVALALVSGVTLYGYTYAYAKPADCLLMRELFNPIPNQKPLKFKEMLKPPDNKSSIIATDVVSAVLIYTVKVTDVNRYSEVFKTALAWKLASDLAIPLTKDVKKQANTLAVYTRYIGEAQMIESNEGEVDTEVVNDFIQSRQI